MPDSTSIPDDVAADERETPKGRSPVERLIVWSLIGVLVVVVGIEAASKNGYDKTFAAVQDRFINKEGMNRLSDLRPDISGWPSEKESDGQKVGGTAANKVIALKWFSFFKHYEIQLTVEASEEDPALISYATPDAAEPEPIKTAGGSGEDVAAGGGMDGYGGSPTAAMPGGGFSPGGPGGFGAPGGGGPGGGGPGGGGPGGGQRGGRGRPSPGLLGDVEQEWVQAELGMTEDQLAKLPEIVASIRPDFSTLQSLPEEERRAAFLGMNSEMEAKGEAAAKEILDDEQFARARELMFQRLGSEAFAREDVATELGLDESQKKQVADLMAELQGAERALGFRVSREERDEAKGPWKALLQDVLSDEQTGKWEALLGAPPEKGPEPEPPARPQRPASDSE